MSDDDRSASALGKPVSRIRNKLAALAGLPEVVRDGVADQMAGGRLLSVGPVVAEGDIALFEAELGDRLPVSYRRLLSGVGDGPFGPGFEMRGVAAWSPSRTFAIGPRVFRLAHYDTVEEHGDQSWVVAASLGDLRAACVDGELRTLELADYGCGMSAVVVLRGPARGEVWLNDPNLGIVGPWRYFDAMFHSPTFDRGYELSDRRFDVLAWYESWLDCLLLVASQLAETDGPAA